MPRREPWLTRSVGCVIETYIQETDRVAGKSKAVSADPIILRIYSPDVLPLTLVDTPGITRVPVGDQPSNIEAQIRNMVLSFIKQKNAIILAVQPANQDIATSDAIKLAHEVDPDGTRTIGVLTKLDLMDRGTNALDILTGRAYPLRLGFVGIVNRSQEDINSNKSIQRSLQEEAEFFARHPLYSQLAAHNGTRFLAERCNQLLTAHIRDSLPELKNNLRTRIKQVKKELAEIGEAPVEATSDKACEWPFLLSLELSRALLDHSECVYSFIIEHSHGTALGALADFESILGCLPRGNRGNSCRCHFRSIVRLY